MSRMMLVPMIALLLASSHAFGQDVQREKNQGTSKPVVGEMLVAEDTRGNIYTSQSIDMNCDYYRWWNDDVVSAFVDPDFSGCVLMSATLSMKYGDVDFYDQDAFNAELDVVQFGPGSLDVLKGYNNSWEGASWDVKDRVSANTGNYIDFAVNVDAAHTADHWAVYLCEAVLQTNWCCGVNCPVPVPVDQEMEMK